MDFFAYLKKSLQEGEEKKQEPLKLAIQRNGYNPKPLEKYYHLKPQPSPYPWHFIDGGQALLFQGAEVIVALLRIAKGFQPFLVTSFYCLVVPSLDNGKLNGYEATLWDEQGNLNHTWFFPLQQDPFTGKQRSLEDIPALVRRLLELSAIQDAPQNAVVVLDGTLECHSDEEKELLEQSLSVIKEKNLIVLAIAKTSNLLLTNGRGLSSLVHYAPFHPFALMNPVSIAHSHHPAAMVFAQLHQKSPYVFRIERLLSDNDASARASSAWESLLNWLASSALDPAFLGYPYGLVKADQLARISNQEASYEKTKLSMKLGKEGILISATKDAHALLDKLQY